MRTIAGLLLDGTPGDPRWVGSRRRFAQEGQRRGVRVEQVCGDEDIIAACQDFEVHP